MAELEALKEGVEPESDDDTRSSETDTLSENADETKARGRWGGRFEFLLAIVGYTVATGSVWRFPIICAKNGGGAFLIPFTFFMLTCGGPLYYLEVCLGQFSGKSAVAAFELCPLFKGLGFLMGVISLLVIWYIMTVMMWIIYYLYSSFATVLPWTSCDNWWNTVNCTEMFTTDRQNTTHFLDVTQQLNDTLSPLQVTLATNISSTVTTLMKASTPRATNSPAYEFWVHNVLRKSDGLEEFGAIQLHLAVCMFIGWLLVVLAVIKGVETLGKVVYVTATAPFLFLTIMLVRGLTLDGAVDGLIYYLVPDFQKLTNYEVWLEAAVQVFYSLGPTWGGVITMSSYNDFHKKSLSDTTICVVTDLFTNFYSGLTVFCIIGFMAHEAGVSVAELAKVSGPGLVFIAYPTAVTRMPLPHLWAVLFFLMMITVAFDSDFGMFETVTSAIIDMYPEKLVRRRPLVNSVVGLILFIVSLPFCCNGGLYLFQLVDWYSSAFALILGSALEGIVIAWIYGADRFSRDITMMTGRHTSVFTRVLWVLVIPFSMIVTFILMMMGYSAPDYGDGYVYKPYAIGLGFFMGLLPILALIAGALWQLTQTSGDIFKRMRTLLVPGPAWGPARKSNMEQYKSDPYLYPHSYVRRMWLNVRGPKDTPWF